MQGQLKCESNKISEQMEKHKIGSNFFCVRLLNFNERSLEFVSMRSLPKWRKIKKNIRRKYQMVTLLIG